MKKVLSVILSVILIFVMFGCKQEVDTTLEKDKNTVAASTPTPTPDSNEENETMYKTKEDFDSITIGESTFRDVYDIAPQETMHVTSYGGFCDYPMKDGGYIRIEFYGKDLTVGAIEVNTTLEKDKNTVAASTPTQTTTTEKYTLVVQGQDITQGNYVHFCENPKYVALPFTAVMKALGAKIQQKSENIIELNFNSETFVLDTKAVTLVKAESSTNFIIPAPGSKVYYQIVENEFVIDDITFNTIAMMIGVKLKVDINYQQHIVEIDYQ